MNFTKWLSVVNTNLFAEIKLQIPDLPDEPFRDYYDDGLEPHEVVDIMIIRNAVFVTD
jgi:hypothetical protein